MKYDAINAKIAGMSAKLLSYDDYLSLCNAGNVYELLAELKYHISYRCISDDWTSIGSQISPYLDEDYAKIRCFINDSNIRRYLVNLLIKHRTSSDALHYYTNLWKDKDRYLSGASKDIAAKIHGTEIDMYNLICIYRLKKNYKPVKEFVYKHILPINYKLPPEMVSQLVETDTPAAMREIIQSTCYGKYFGEGDSYSAFYKALSDVYKRVSYKNTNSIAPIIYYFFRKGMEIKNIVTIFEGVNYSLAPDEIMDKMRGLNYA